MHMQIRDSHIHPHPRGMNTGGEEKRCTLKTVLQSTAAFISSTADERANADVCHSRINIQAADGEMMGVGPDKTPT